MDIRRANLLICEDEAAASREAAERFTCAAVNAVAERGSFSVAVSGGSTPKGMLENLASDKNSPIIPWYRTELYFADERCVPPDSQDSNYRMVHELLLATVPIPEMNVHRFEGELDPDVAAERYEEEIHRVMGPDPRFDLIVLGMGEDTHTASLFPHTPALHETGRHAIANYVHKLNVHRLTMTFPLINRACSIIILVFGENKSQPLANAMRRDDDIELHPIQAIKPTHGRLLWIVDRAAASKL